jgi:hypothetical protein
MYRYLSRDGIQQAISIINEDPEHLQAAKLLTGKFLMRVLDAPEGKDVNVTYVFEKGRCVEWLYEDAPAPSPLRERPFKALKDGIARVTAKYDMLVKLDKGELEISDAFRSPDYIIEGSMLMLVPLLQAVDSWNRKTRSIPKEYE